MRVAFVTPRFGPEVLGGAESAARSFAIHLASAGVDVSVFSTCALDHLTWENVLRSGDELDHGVTVHRFPTDRPRDPEGLHLDGRLRPDPAGASLEDARRWLELNGPVSTPLLGALGDADADVFVFYPYLYHPTVAGVPLVSAPAVLHPAAHDEPALYLPIFRETFDAVTGFVFQTAAERALVESVHAIADRPQILLGLGIDDPLPRRRPGTAVAGLPPDRPYLLALGRVDPHKGSPMLASWFLEYRRRRPRRDLAFVFAGPIACDLPVDPSIVATGPVDEPDKHDLLADALLLASGSAFEAFSLVVPEAWRAGIPVLVNALCGPTVEHCSRSAGGLPFDSYLSFESILDRLLDDFPLRRQLAANGLHHTEAHFSWPLVTTRYLHFLEAIASRPSR